MPFIGKMGGEGVEVAVVASLFAGNKVFVGLERFDSNTADLHDVLGFFERTILFSWANAVPIPTPATKVIRRIVTRMCFVFFIIPYLPFSHYGAPCPQNLLQLAVCSC